MSRFDAAHIIGDLGTSSGGRLMDRCWNREAELGAPVLGLRRSRSLADFARVGLVQVHIIKYDPGGDVREDEV